MSNPQGDGASRDPIRDLRIFVGGFQEEPLHYITDHELKRLRAIEAASLVTDPASVRDAAESEPLNVWDQCDALRARVAGLEGELEALRESNLRLAGEVGTECGNLKNALDELTDARALLAVERERVIEERHETANLAVLVDQCDRVLAFLGDGADRDDRSMIDDFRIAVDAVRQLRALAQPRAERETR